MPDSNFKRISKRLLSVGPTMLVLTGCFAYSTFQILAGQIELDTGDASKYSTIALYMAEDTNLLATEQLDHVGALATSAVFAMSKIGFEVLSLEEVDSSAVFLLANLLSSYLLALIGWLYVRKTAGDYAAFFSVALLIGNQFFVNHSLNTYAEPMGSLFVLLAAFLVIKCKTETRGVITAAICLLIASLFRHEYILFGWYLALWLCLRKKLALASIAASVSSLFYFTKRLYQALVGSASADYQAWLDQPLQGTAADRFSDGIGVLLETFRIDFLPLGLVIGLLLLTCTLGIVLKNRKDPQLLMMFILCHSVVLLLLWTTGIVPHVQQRYAAVVEYLLPFAIGCSLVYLNLPRRIAFRQLRSSLHLILLATIVVISALALRTNRAEVYNVRYNRIPSSIANARKFLKERIKQEDKLYFGYGAWSGYLQNKCYQFSRLGNSYAYSNEGFYGWVPRSFTIPRERSEDISDLVATRHRDFATIAPDYVILSNSLNVSPFTHFARKRGAGAIRPFLLPAEDTISLRWQSPYAKTTPNLIFYKVFPLDGDWGEIIIYHAKPGNPT